MPFYLGLFVLSASTLMYQVILTRLLSVTAWYYLAFVAISMSLFGLTAGALLVQARADLFPPERVRQRMAQAARFMGLSIPVSLLTMLAVPLELSYALQTLYSFLFFSAIVSVPLVCGGVAVCLALTRYGTPFGRTYAVDLAGAATGCFLALALLRVLDAPSALLAVSSLVLLAAALLARAAGGAARAQLRWAAVLAGLAVLNALTPHGIQPIWAKGRVDPRHNILLEIWNPISRVRAYKPQFGAPALAGPSPLTPKIQVLTIFVDIDNDAATLITQFDGNASQLDYFKFDVASLPAELRAGGRAAIIGVGGGRDVLAAASFGYTRIVGIEVNPAIADLATRRLASFSGLRSLPAAEYHVDEGRSYLLRTPETFDLIQATLVDTWAGTAAGAMALTENSLYTVEAWRLFKRKLAPGGLLAFSRWSSAGEGYQSRRLFSLAWAALLLEGVQRPGDQLAYVSCSGVATLMLSNAPLSPADLRRIEEIAEERRFEILYLPGRPTRDPVLRQIGEATDVEQLKALRFGGQIDYSPTFDDSPFFFNALRLRHLMAAVRDGDSALLLGTGSIRGGNLRALGFLLLFLLAATLLLLFTVVWPLRRQLGRSLDASAARTAAYFTTIGLAFMLVEMAMMQRLSLFLGHPIYGLVVVLAGLILFTGVGSLMSDRFKLSRAAQRLPALAAAACVGAYALAAAQATEAFAAAVTPVRIAISLALVAVPGIVMGQCLPAGVRALRAAGHDERLPWAWALNGSASVLGTFVGIFVAMEYGLTTCLLAGIAGYVIAALAMETRAQEAAQAETAAPEALSA